MKKQWYFVFFLAQQLNAAPMTSGWLLGTGRSGAMFTSGFESAVLNPAGLSVPCVQLPFQKKQTGQEIGANQNQEKKTTHVPPKKPLQKKQVTICPSIFSWRFPFLEMSQSTLKISQIGSQQEKMNHLIGHIGKPYHLQLEEDISWTGRDFALGVIHTERGQGIVFNDLENFGIETAKMSMDRKLTLIVATSRQTEWSALKLGASLRFISHQHKSMSASLTDVEALKKFKDLLDLEKAYGVALDLGMKYATENNFGFGFVLRQVGDSSLRSKTRTYKETEEHKQSLDFISGLRVGLLKQKLELSWDINDLLSRVENNPFKKIHFGTSLNFTSGLSILSGINQGNPTYGVGHKSKFFEWVLGSYTEEIGNKIGFRTDDRYFFQSRFQF